MDKSEFQIKTEKLLQAEYDEYASGCGCYHDCECNYYQRKILIQSLARELDIVLKKKV